MNVERMIKAQYIEATLKLLLYNNFICCNVISKAEFNVSLANVKNVLSKLHRRRRSVESFEWWNHLNFAQKFSVSSFNIDINNL